MPEALATLHFAPDLGLPTLQLQRGDVLLLTGPNGSGKTSLLRALAGLPSAKPPLAVAVAGSDPRSLPAADLAKTVAVALQDPRDTLIGLTVQGEFDLRSRPLPLGLQPLAQRDVALLSLGEARRISLATASALVPLLLLDEPAEGLDATGRAALLDLIARARAAGAVVVASHDPALRRVATRTLALRPDGDVHAPPLPPAGTTSHLRMAARTVQRGTQTVHLPALALPSGLHALQGPNGAGKSTLLLRLAGLLDADGVTVSGTPVRTGHNVRLLLPNVRDLFVRPTVADEVSGCDDLGLIPAALLERHPLTLSAGEAQRVALTKVLGRPASVYALDEPEAHLDADGRQTLLHILAAKVAQGACVVLATHDATLAAWCHQRITVGTVSP